MSGVSKAVGRAVEFVMKEQAVRCAGKSGEWMTVGQVAEAIEVSRPTARKYMMILVGAGVVEKSIQDDYIKTAYYRYVAQGE